MNRTTILGGSLLVAGLVGYVVGIYVEYPGQAVSVTAVMVGITLTAIAGRSSREAAS